MVTHLRSQVDQRQQQFDQMKKTAETSQSPLNQESIIRNELLMQKPGEYIVQMPDLPQPIIEKKMMEKQLTPWEEWRQILDF